MDKIFVPDKTFFVLGNLGFVLDKKYFVRAEGRGNSFFNFDFFFLENFSSPTSVIPQALASKV